jgi:hypothetical protein
MTKYALVIFKITNIGGKYLRGYEHYEYSYYEYKNVSGMSHKEIVEEVYNGVEVNQDDNDQHKFWLSDSISDEFIKEVQVYGIQPMTHVELGVLKKFGVL